MCAMETRQLDAVVLVTVSVSPVTRAALLLSNAL